jgi:tetratricopeptide (TPR) repeat protein
MLADRGGKLDEAAALIRRALDQDPHNSAYLDSLGWAYYKQKRLGDAEPLLRKAAHQAPANSVIQSHLGDLLQALGKREEAVDAWRRALAGDGEDIDRRELEAKIKNSQAKPRP